MRDIFPARILGLSPSPQQLTAIARGGGFPVLDLPGSGTAAELTRATARLRGFPYGVRVPTGRAIPSEVIRDCGVSLTLQGIASPATGLPMLAEVASVQQAAQAVELGAIGLVAVAAELSAFVLLQQLLDLYGDQVPVWATGIGPRTAVGAVAGGAAGVLIDEQLALLPEATSVRRQSLPDSSLAPLFAQRYRTTESAIRSLRAAVDDLPIQADQGVPLCRTLGSALPIAQGPMTRVSDQPAFAAAVAEHGGFPFVAVATSNGVQTTDLLAKTAHALGDRPWGAGLLGFIDANKRGEQLSAVLAAKPRCALLAGGKLAQAKALEAQGIATYMHVPSPILLQQFLDAGIKRFVFEGAECGGHVGPRSSFALWEQQLDVLQGHGPGLEILFAGGIHDARSAAIVAAAAADLATAGAGIGVLMGTAYLFTREAVTTGAITELFQEQAIQAEATVTLETAPGHSTRCLPSPYTTQFEALKSELADVPRQEAWQQLEELNTGRLRIASKGLTREGAQLVSVDADAQLDQGLYMAGQVSVLRDARTTIADLHTAVTDGAAELLRTRVPRQPVAAESRDIAIVGIACTFAGAPDLPAFWSNILNGVDSVTEVPTDRWDSTIYADQSTSRWGGFLPAVEFDPLAYGIPPTSMASIDPAQLVSLETARRALADAGYDERPFDRERTSVLFGAEAGSDLANAEVLRALLPSYLGEVPAELLGQLPELTEDSFPGTLANVISGRIANRLDLRGANYTVDAACASSLAALDIAVKELRSGSSSMVLCGAVDLHNGINDYLNFTSAGALSPTGRCRPFDASADGIALGEGVACLVLKRRTDAERDGDRVYGVIKGVGAASDGKALGLTAPRPEGQRRALERAYEDAGVSPAEVCLVEAHGTGTVVGDATELRTLTEFFTDAGAQPGSIALGSVKSQIGHTKCAAGLAGLIKATLALWHEVVPPTLHLDSPNTAWDADRSPFTFSTTARPAPGLHGLAGVSAFGFGGTNFHAVLAPGPISPDRAHALRDWKAELPAITVGETTPGKLAFLFPGQGSQRTGMLAELFVHFPDLADSMRSHPDLVSAVFPPRAFDDARITAQNEAVTDTRVAQPALGLVESAVCGLLAELGVRPDFLAGHSYGELVALSVAGAFDTATLVELSRARAEAIAGMPSGAMAAVRARYDDVAETLAGLDVVVANHNAPEQIVISGSVSAIDHSVAHLRTRGIAAKRIPVSCAFHSPLVAEAGDLFAKTLRDAPIQDPALPVWSNRTSKQYEAGSVREELALQIPSAVRFVDQIEDMYAAGARIFLEVGPGRVLSRLTGEILGDRPHQVLACEPGLNGFLTTLGALAKAGVPVDTDRLFRGRPTPPEPRTDVWTVNGAVVRQPNGQIPTNGLTPAQQIPRSIMNEPAQRDQVIVEFLRTSREFVAGQRDVMLGYLGTAPAAPRPSEPIPAPAVVVVPVQELTVVEEPVAEAVATDVRATVLAVISDRTGFPASMIQGDLDLEADLSIDSIKRTEIAGTLLTKLGLTKLGLTAVDSTDLLVRQRTANGLVTQLELLLTPTTSEEPETGARVSSDAVDPALATSEGPETGARVSSDVVGGGAPRRYVSRAKACPPAEGTSLHGTTFTVLGPDDLAESIRERLTGAGATAVEGADADLVVSLDALTDTGESPAPRLFSQLKAARGTFLAVATTSDGLRGLFRAAALERDAITRLVLLDNLDHPAEIVLAEARTADDVVVAHHNDDGRWTDVPVNEELGSLAHSGAGPGSGELQAIGLDADSVVLLVGGARGITARTAIALAANGSRIELAGRTPWPMDHDDAALPDDPQAIRETLIARGGSIADIERHVRTVLAQREIGRTLDQIKAAGGQAGYQGVDVQDSEAVHQLVKDVVTRHGRIDGVVYAAGVIDDKLMALKDDTSFRTVFETKVTGANTLLTALTEEKIQPAFITFFGSISAVLGNRGQTDYAAANDALEDLATRWNGRALTVHWGPWAPADDHSGMVTPELAREYERRNVALIDPEEGTAALLRELAYGSPDVSAVLYTASLW
ncbi:SDR family NAD(P)-dependent oxidoreductase [Kribbella sp. NPDC058245]|uniref:SDR family NAD(P)-dependent oxidoreductase n=1 Tax=Kribbella sp. NPDC058245 TaxID=3346399 RepID=UPI0036EC3930